MSGIEVRVLNEGDSSIYARSVQSRLVNAPSSPPLTSKAIQVASGRRKGFQSKNDSAVEKITEKKVSARMPRFEEGELKDSVTKLEPILIDQDSKLSSSRRRKDARPPVNQPTILNPSQEIQLDPRLQKEYGDQLVHINVSPPLARKLESARRPVSNVRPTPTFHPGEETAVSNQPIPRESTPPPRPLPPRPVEKPSIKEEISNVVEEDEVEIIGEVSPVATRRSPPTSKSKTSRSKTSREKSARAPPPVVEVVDEQQGEDRYSNRRSERPQSPHRVKQQKKKLNGVKVQGKRMVKKESSDSPSPQVESVTESSTSNEVTSRRKIKSRQAALEKKLTENYEDGEFDVEDDAHFRDAIKLGLEASRKESIQEAIAAGHDLSAEILGHVTRPDAVGEVVEKLVSQRREKLRESKRRQASSKQKSSEKPPPFKPNRSKKVAPRPPPPPVEDDDSEEGPDIETVEEPKDEVSPPLPKSKPRAKITISDGVPRPSPRLAGTPIGIVNNPSQAEETEPLPPAAAAKPPSQPKKAPPKEKEEQDSDEEEKKVKLPNAHRKPKKGDLTRPDALGQQDSIYDPLEADQPFGDENDSVGDDKYEESEEDEEKMTINEKKDEMLYRFKLVKEAYPNVALPRITKKMKLAKMVRHYDHVMSRIKLKIKTGNFKIFLVGGFLLMQFGIKKATGMDSSGFALNQMYSMKRYEPYLRQFGESDFSSIGSDLPLMVRLPFFMAVNMGIFMVAKMIFKATGKDVTDQFYKLYSQLTGGDDYFYIKEEDGKTGLEGGDEGGDGGGGMFGMIKSFMGLMGGMGGSGGGGSNDDAPKRGEAPAATYKRKRPPKKE